MNAEAFVLSLFAMVWHSKPDSKGHRNEKRAVAAFGCHDPGGPVDHRLGGIPEWFRAIYNASGTRVDASGVDIIVWTDIGRVRIQIKSSRKSAMLFEERQQSGRYRKDISVVVIDEDNHGPRDVRKLIIAAATEQYEKLLAKTASKVGVQFSVGAT